MEKTILFLAMGVNKLLLFFCSLLFLLVGTNSVLAQSLTDLKKSKLNLSERISLDSLTHLIHQRTNIRVSFNSRKVKGSQTIYFRTGSYSVYAVLERMKMQTSLNWQLYKSYVIFQVQDKKQSAGGPKKTIALKKTTVVSNERTINYYRGPYSAEQAVKSFSLEDSIYAKLLQNRTAGIQLADRGVDSTEADNSRAAAFRLDPFFRASLLVNHLPATQFWLQGGFDKIHLILLTGTNFRYTEWGGGLGSVVKKGQQSSWMLASTISFLRNNKSVVDTIAGELSLLTKATLFSVSLSWNRYLDAEKKWQLGVGLSYNQLSTRFYQDGIPVKVSDLADSFSKTYKGLSLVRPLSTFSNSFAINRDRFTLSWPGIFLQLGIRL